MASAPQQGVGAAAGIPQYVRAAAATPVQYISNAVSATANAAREVVKPENYARVVDNYVATPATNLVKPAIDQFSSNKYVQGTSEFLNANSLVAKFAFLIVILIVFIILLRIGASILGRWFSPSNSPFLISGLVDGKHMVRIPADPSASGSIPIMRSKNDPDGTVFTWSVWIRIDDLVYKAGQHRHIFHKGNDQVVHDTGLIEPNNAPGLYIAPDTNNLVVRMNTFGSDSIVDTVTINDVPLNKWVNVIIRVDRQRRMDVFINGRLARRHILSGVPRQNYGDVFVAMNGGFAGAISDLRYFADSIGETTIMNIVHSGPNTSPAGDKSMSGDVAGISPNPQYLSLQWFFNNQ